VTPFNLDPQDKLSLGENIAQHIQSLLHQGKLRPGDTLPSQRELAQQYGTGVAAVREAISILSAAGVVDARPGRGTLILEAAEQPPSVNLWLGAVTSEQEALDFLDTRQALEHYTIARAARHATPEQQDELRRVLARMQAARGDPELFVQADLALHFAIARAAGNPVMVRLLHAIHTPISHVLRVISHQLIAEGRFHELYAVHETLVDAILRRDPDAALAAFDTMMGAVLGGEDGDTLGLALGQQHHEFLTAITGQYIAIAQAGRGNRSESLQHLVAGRMTVEIVDSLEMIQVDQRQPMHLLLVHGLQLATGNAQEMPAVEQPGQFIGGHQVFELAHHSAQRVLMRLQGKPALAHALPRGLDEARVNHQPRQHDQQNAGLQGGQRRIVQPEVVTVPQRDRAEAEKHQHRATHEGPPRQMKQAEQQDQHIEDQELAPRLLQMRDQPRLPAEAEQHLRFGQARVGEAQVGA